MQEAVTGMPQCQQHALILDNPGTQPARKNYAGPARPVNAKCAPAMPISPATE